MPSSQQISGDTTGAIAIESRSTGLSRTATGAAEGVARAQSLPRDRHVSRYPLISIAQKIQTLICRVAASASEGVIRPRAGARGYRKVQSSKDVGITFWFAPRAPPTSEVASSANPLATGHNEVWRKWQAAPIRTNALRTALCSSPLKTQGHGCKPPSRFEGWLAGDDSIAVVQELGDADGSREPQLLRFDCLVAMSEEIAQPDDRRPRNFRMLRLHLTRHAIRGLAHNKECPLQRGSGRSLAFARELSERH